MKNLIVLSLLMTTALLSFGQEKVPFWEKHWANQAGKDSTEISAWENTNLETKKWEDVKHIFIPSDLLSDTLIIEKITVKQHRSDFKYKQKVYYDSAKVDTMKARFRPEMPGFMTNQEQEIKYILDNYKGAAVSSLSTNISKLSVANHRYVLKKILKINHLNKKTGHGDAIIEYYFYDRKEKRDYPHMSTDIEWLVEHMNQ